MDYNTQRERLLMPEYGRLVQQMVDYALTIEDREARQNCAETIVRVMENFFPHSKNVPDFEHKLWDHLAAISKYRLDVDYPNGMRPTPPDNNKPEPLPYPMQKIKQRTYGHLIESLFDKLKDMPAGEERHQLALVVAQQMVRTLQIWNKDALNINKIVDDIAKYTDGKVILQPEEVIVRPMTPSTPARPTKRSRKK